MKILKESIAKLGILVPITVYQETGPRRTSPTRYLILDGERRWRCARDLTLRNVPAIIVEEPSEEQNILTMFHIHNVRAGWQLMPTALKLQVLMDMLGETNERTLAELTKLSISHIRRCKILLTYPDHFQNLMLAPPSERMKADFFVELDRIRRPALAERFPPWISRGDKNSIQIVLDKYMAGTIKAVTEFRHLAEVYRASIEIKRVPEFMRRLESFLAHPATPVDAVNVPGASFAKEAKEIGRSANRLITQLESVDLGDVSSDLRTIASLQNLLQLLQRKLEDALLMGPRHDSTDDN
jgi:ParB family chromosome partitioning protein